MLTTWLNRSVEPIRWLIVIGIAYTLATAALSLFSGGSITPVLQPGSPGEANPGRPARTVNANTVLQAHIFGEAGVETRSTATVAQQPLKDTTLSLELQGVFVADQAAESAAIVAQRGKGGIRYKIDDSLPGNAVLVEVNSDHIVLRRAGTLETLRFPKSGAQFLADKDADNNAGDEPPARERRTRPRVGGPMSDATPAAASPREFVENYREQLASDPQAALNDLGIEQVSDEGASGYRLGNLAQSPAFSQTGLQAGDVILSVNGRPVGDIQQDQLEIDNVLAEGAARLEIQRGNRRFFVTASLK